VSSLLISILLAGGAVGLGMWIIAIGLVQPRPDLVATLTAPRPVTASRRQELQTLSRQRFRAGLEDRLGRWQIAVPSKDLAILGLAKGRFLLWRIGVALLLLLTGPLYAVLIWALGAGVPYVVPQLFGLVAAGIGWYSVGVWIRDRSSTRRRQMRYALVSYLTLVALHRAAGLGMGAALARAAESSPAWTYRRIGDRIASSAREGESPWTGLSDLALELGINELADLASIAHTAGQRGAGVYSTLMARAASLRRELQKQEETAAAQTTTYLVLPMLLMLIAAMGFLAYPALTTFLTA